YWISTILSRMMPWDLNDYLQAPIQSGSGKFLSGSLEEVHQPLSISRLITSPRPSPGGRGAELVGWAKPPGTAVCPTNHLNINHYHFGKINTSL
ncbi:hypothetical protein, partial [Candidatus Thiosymbion oneisti]|uniref:hypothetical protein n=1 Tax=Candidatus Thiosymbion oneisti TaxID=589554 RepID=UPI001C406EFD